MDRMGWMTSGGRFRMDVAARIRAQLPRAVDEKITDIVLDSDPYLLVARVVLVGPNGRRWKVRLERDDDGLMRKLPDEFIALVAVEL